MATTEECVLATIEGMAVLWRESNPKESQSNSAAGIARRLGRREAAVTAISLLLGMPREDVTTALKIGAL